MQESGCDQCPLHNHPSVPGYGTPGGLAIVGESPGTSEVTQGKPFVGMSGKMLREILTALGVNPDEVWITNACLCHPSHNDTPTEDAITACRGRLLDELRGVGATQILALGNTAIQALVPGSGSVTTVRGHWLWVEELGVYAMPTYHPAAVLRNPEGFRDLAKDIENSLTMPTEKLPDSVPPFHTVCKAQWDIDQMVKTIYTTKPSHLVCDIETAGYHSETGRILCIGIACAEDKIWIIPDYLFDDFYIRHTVKSLMEDQKLYWAGQNAYQFDVVWLDQHYGIYWRPSLDTMLAHFSLDERHLGHGLKDQAADRYQAPDYDKGLDHYLAPIKKERMQRHQVEVRAYRKEYGKEADTSHILADPEPDYGNLPLELLYPYLAYDCYYTWKLVPDLYDEMEQDSVLHVHDEILLPLAYTLGEIEQVGVTIDVEYLSRVGGTLDTWVERSLEDLQIQARKICTEAVHKARIPSDEVTLCGIEEKLQDFNPNSHLQVSTLIYDVLKMKATRTGDKRQTGSRSVDKITLGTFQHPICKSIIEHRGKMKLKGTYVEGILSRLDKTQRIHSDFLIFGTRTSRLSSSNPNLQNIPINAAGPIIRDAFTATVEEWQLKDPLWKKIIKIHRELNYPGGRIPHPDGEWVLLESDYSQLELRVVAYFSGDAFLSETFRNGGDIHAAVATKVFHVKPEDITVLLRFLAKQINFGIIYGRQAKSLALGELNCSVAEAQKWYNEYMAQFRGLQAWIKETQGKVLQEGIIETAFGRKRRFPCITKTNRSDIERIAVNTPVQGTAADICNTALIRIYPQLDPEYARILLTVHDSIMYEVRRKKVPEVMKLVRYEMEDNCPIKADFPFTIDFKVGYRWGSLEKVEDINKLDGCFEKARTTYPRDKIALR